MIKQLSQSQITIIQTLGDGACHSGTELGHLAGISRTAIWKRIKQLIELGVPIECLPQKGYKLTSPMDLLDAATIEHYLCNEQQTESPPLFEHDIALPNHTQQQAIYTLSAPIHLFTSIDSTNRYLKSRPTGQPMEICCAEQQTEGRGRFNRSWYSPFGENLYCSVRLQLACDLASLSGLSLVTSLSIRKALHDYLNIDTIAVKWPNDLIWQDKKLCGTLIEIQAETHGLIHIIIGIGLNVNAINRGQPEIDKPWCSLREITGRMIDRNELTAKLIITLKHDLNHFMIHGLNGFQREWIEADYLKNQIVTVSNLIGDICGKAMGINESGQLRILDKDGVEHVLSSGDTSVKKKG